MQRTLCTALLVLLYKVWSVLKHAVRNALVETGMCLIQMALVLDGFQNFNVIRLTEEIENQPEARVNW